MTSFTELGLAPALLQALKTEGYETPTPIQAQAIPHILEGRDLLGIAQTGTGKTAAFALPILHRLAANKQRPLRRGCRVLVLSPTRELASQIADGFRRYGRNLGTSVAVVFGGVSHSQQIRAMANGVDVLVATPGRLLDHMGGGTIEVAGTEILVLDEADQMLDLGFLVPIRRIVAKLSTRRQSLFFSATMPAAIGKLAAELLSEPAQVSVTPVATTVERIAQRVIHVEAAAKRSILTGLLADPEMSRTLIFTRTKHGADKVVRHLEAAGIDAAAIHGNKNQNQRERALAAFKSGRVRALVATDIAARGIDVDGVTHVVNFELPNVPESYVHRIGRTARAGADGIAISLCDHEERSYLRSIEKLIRQTIPAVDQSGAPVAPPPMRPAAAPSRPAGRPGGGQRQRPPQRNGDGRARGAHPGGGAGGHAAPRHAAPRPEADRTGDREEFGRMPWMRKAEGGSQGAPGRSGRGPQRRAAR